MRNSRRARVNALVRIRLCCRSQSISVHRETRQRILQIEELAMEVGVASKLSVVSENELAVILKVRNLLGIERLMIEV